MPEHNVGYTLMCKQKHHSLLHRSEASSHSQPKSENRSVALATSSYSTTIREHPSRSEQNLVEGPSTFAEARWFKNFATQLQSIRYSTVLLATTVVDVMLNDERYSVRALIDSAATILVLNGAITANSTNIKTDAYVVEQLTGRLPTCALADVSDFDLFEWDFDLFEMGFRFVRNSSF